MSYDMSERVEPIYQYLLEKSFPLDSYGLTIHYLKKDSSPANEILFTAKRLEKPIYAILCTAELNSIKSTESSCQKDIRIGKKLSLPYFFPIKLLSEWEKIDENINIFAKKILDKDYFCIFFGMVFNR